MGGLEFCVLVNLLEKNVQQFASQDQKVCALGELLIDESV